MRRYLVAVALLVLVLAAYAAAYVARVPDVVTRVTRVPEAGTQYGDVSLRLMDSGFRVVAVDASGMAVEDPHDLAVVTAQDPPAGAIRPFGSTVRLRVKPPRPTVTVPDVVGLRVSDAVKVLHDAGLALDTGGFIGNDGVVTSTWPEAGRVVQFGGRVGYDTSGK